MLSLAIWWFSFFLELAILFRSIQRKVFHIYPFFSVYIASVLASSSALYLVYILVPNSYTKWYWIIEIPILILGCGIILEILQHVLAPYPGAEKFARFGGLAVFGCAFVFAIAYPRLSQGASLAGSIEALERDLRAIQAIFLVGIVGIISYYGIPLGKNLKGMICGYALFIGTSLINLSLRSYAGFPIHTIWSAVQPFSYDVSLLVWLAAMWSYYPNPAPQYTMQLETDYEALASKTRHAMGGMRSYLVRAGRD